MNFVGHVEVARAVAGATTASPGFLLGAALPDLAAMGRFRLAGRSADDDIAAGVDLHHRTDDAFHRHPLFRTTSSAVSTALTEAGLSRGAARACGHVGVELMLDGHLLTRRTELRGAVDTAIAAAGDRTETLSELIEPAKRADWRTHLGRLAAWDVPDDYDQPAAVARRLQRILGHRPRLRFSADQIDTVAVGLDQYQQAVIEGAGDLLADLEDQLADRA
ncbi:MAG: hypothetical protein AAFO29_22835 [Actinomycetota bacterium]